MSINDPSVTLLLSRHETIPKGKDMAKLEQKERTEFRRAIGRVARKIALLVLPNAEKNDQIQLAQEELERRKRKTQNERELLLVKMKGTQDEKLLANMPEMNFYSTLYVMYMDAPFIKKKYHAHLMESIKRGKRIGKLRSFATEFDEITLLLECLPKDDVEKMVAGIRKNVSKLFEKSQIS